MSSSAVLRFDDFTVSHIPLVLPWFEKEGGNWIEKPTAQFVAFVDSVEYDYHKCLVFDGELPVGYLLYAVEGDGIGGIALLVNPSCRRQGYGRAMIQQVIADLTPRCSHINVGIEPENKASLALFRAVGFHQVGEGTDDEGLFRLVYTLTG